METIEKDTMTDEQRRSLFFNFKALGLDDDGRHCFVSDFTDGRTDSLKDLGYIEAQDMLRYLQELRRNPQERKRRDDLDRKRKGVMRAIGRYLELCGIQHTADYIKGVAVRAAGLVPTEVGHDFNRIDGATLTRIYNEFCRKQSVQGVKSSIPTISLN
ncbi:MAG: hypothetical protein MJZ78_04100 [Bacteroidales bacterium]|nr:hypothetical protein [Bacteroidales bacterium]